MNNTKQTNNNTEDSFSERQDVTCSEGEAVTELSPSNGSPLDGRDFLIFFNSENNQLEFNFFVNGTFHHIGLDENQADVLINFLNKKSKASSIDLYDFFR